MGEEAKVEKKEKSFWETLKELDSEGGAWLEDRQRRIQNVLNKTGQAPVVDKTIGNTMPVGWGGVPGGMNPDGSKPPAVTEVKKEAIEPPDLNVEPGTESGEDSLLGTQAGMAGREFAFPRASAGGMGIPGVVEGEAENYAPFGGEEPWEQAARTLPGEIKGAITAGAQAEGDKADALKDYYKRTQEAQAEEHAVLRQRQIEDQQQIQAKQQQIEEASKRHSDDLADRGQYWKNPGNIISAIGAAFMTLGSNDPTIGVKLINASVNADFKQRKDLADMHMGELRSNLSTYRQIAGNRELGDRLAYAESQRIAAMEVERIGAQFAGPIAKAKAAAISGEFMRNYTIQMGQLHAAMVFNKAHIENPAIAQAHQNSGNWKFYGQGGAQPTVNGQPVAGVVGGGAPAAGGKALGKAVGGPGVVRKLWSDLDRPMDPKARELINSRYPGAAEQLDSEKADIVRRIWSVSKRNPDKFNEKMEEFERWVETDIKEISKASAEHVSDISGVRRLETHMKVLKQVADRLHKTPDELIDTVASKTFGSSNVKEWKDLMMAMNNAGGGNKSQKLNADLDEAVGAFRQLLAGNVNAYIKDVSGVSTSVTEASRLKQVVSTDHSWNAIGQFVADSSARSSAKLRNAANTAAHPVSGTLFLVQTGIGSPKLDTQGAGKKSK
jgi:hypothetical protein